MSTIILTKKRKLFSCYEFFSGGGMVRAGLGSEWSCLFANDFDRKKSETYIKNWGNKELKTTDIKTLTVHDLPSPVDLAWASFPCQDLSLAGGGAGLKGERSGTFWPFWSLMKKIIQKGNSPRVIVLENVCGALTSHNGNDFSSICSSFSEVGYKFGAVVIDAAYFIPQSRPRLFVIGVSPDSSIPDHLVGAGASEQWHPRSLRTAFDKLPPELKDNWLWWRMPPPALNSFRFADLIEDVPTGVNWHTVEETARLLTMMSPVNLAKVEQAKRSGKRMVGAIYKRTRLNEEGFKVQRAEVRFDDIAGCLRTPAGGSSRQLILVVEREQVKSRLISSRETARLMGLSDSYVLPENYNEAYHLTGDGVVVPVVRYLAENIFEPLIAENNKAILKLVAL